MTDQVNDLTKPTEPALPADSLLNEVNNAVDFTAGKPEGFPDDFWDADKNAPAVDKLYKEFQNRDKIAKDLRVKLSRGEFTGQAPADINEYIVELSDELKPIVPDGDPLFDAARQAAKDAGLPKEAFSKFMTPIISKLAELKAQQDQGPSEAEIEQFRSEEIAKLGPAGTKVVSAVGAFIDQLHSGGTFSDAEAATAKAMANSAEAVKVLNKLRMMSGAPDQVPVEIPVDTKASRSDIEAKMAKAFASKNEEEYKKYSAMLTRFN